MKKFSFTLTLSAFVLAACGSGGSEGTPPSEVPVTTAKTFSEAVARAETTGSIPILDRTTAVVGTDGNANSIRDDIEAYINSLPDTEPQKNALRQTAQAFTAVLSTDVSNNVDLNIASIKLSNSSSCLFSRYPSGIANKRAREMEKFHINTKQRFDIYDAYNAALNGTTSLSPIGDGCDN